MKRTKKGLQVDSRGIIGPIKIDDPQRNSSSGRKTTTPKKIPNPTVIQRKARLVTSFLSPLTGFMNLIYKKAPRPNSGINKVLNDNIEKVVKGEYPRFKMDYSQVILSKGDLTNPLLMFTSSPEAGKLVFNWIDDSGFDNALPTDKMFVAVLNTDTRTWTAALDTASRKDCHSEIDVPEFRNKMVHVYIGFVSEDLMRTSTSGYAGMLRVY